MEEAFRYFILGRNCERINALIYVHMKNKFRQGTEKPLVGYYDSPVNLQPVNL